MIGSTSVRSRAEELGKRSVEDADDVDEEDIAETGRHAPAGRPKGVKAVKREERIIEHQTQLLEKLGTVQLSLQP